MAEENGFHAPIQGLGQSIELVVGAINTVIILGLPVEGRIEINHLDAPKGRSVHGLSKSSRWLHFFVL